MAVGQRIANAWSSLFGNSREAIVETSKEESAKESVTLAPNVFQLNSADMEDPRFRRITSPATLRDLNPMMHERMQAVCFYLSVVTPFGKRIIGVLVDYVVGEGFKAIAEDPAVQEVIDRFWKDSINRMDENVEALCREQLTFGELCIPVSVNSVDGSVRLGYIDPQEIDVVEYGMMNTSSSPDGEVTIPVAVRLRKRLGESEARRLTTIRMDEDPNSPTYGQLAGDCFFFAINKAKAASRGISELFSLADWVDVFDQMVFDFADRIRMLNSFVWHYVLKGANNQQVEEFKNKVKKSPPRQGGLQVTNDQVEINATSPDLKGADMSEAARVVKLYGMGGAGLPAWFFADPVDANRATAEEMAGPTGKMLTNKQNAMRRVVTAIIEFVIAQAIAHGVLSPEVDRTWKLQVPDLSVKDIGASATALQTAANAAAIAEDRGWVRGQTAARLVHLVMTQLGVEVDPDEFDQAQAEKETRDAKAVNNLDPQKNLADALKNLPPATDVTQ